MGKSIRGFSASKDLPLPDLRDWNGEEEEEYLTSKVGEWPEEEEDVGRDSRMFFRISDEGRDWRSVERKDARSDGGKAARPEAEGRLEEGRGREAGEREDGGGAFSSEGEEEPLDD